MCFELCILNLPKTFLRYVSCERLRIPVDLNFEHVTRITHVFHIEVRCQLALSGDDHLQLVRSHQYVINIQYQDMKLSFDRLR